MNIKLIIIIGFSYLYFFFELFMNIRKKRKNAGIISSDKGSLWLLYAFITIGYFLSFAIGATKIGRIYHWNMLFAIGFALIVIGLFIRIQAILMLNKYFTYTVAKVEDHKLIETGLYKSIRHPGYLGQIIIFIGISSSLSNWLSILFMIAPITIGYLYRIKVEERFMEEQIGEIYSSYKKRTKRLIPLIF
jgi:protein-S-isoprenylcysteine O-methyltransferase Ste14